MSVEIQSDSYQIYTTVRLKMNFKTNICKYILIISKMTENNFVIAPLVRIYKHKAEKLKNKNKQYRCLIR